MNRRKKKTVAQPMNEQEYWDLCYNRNNQFCCDCRYCTIWIGEAWCDYDYHKISDPYKEKDCFRD